MADTRNLAFVAIALLLLQGGLGAQQTTPTRLNNFVVQFADFDLRAAGAPDAVTFALGQPEWLFIELRGDGEASVVLSSGAGEAVVLDSPGETMRHVPAGEVVVSLAAADRATLERLIVRRVPEIMMYMYEGHDPPVPHGHLNHTWEELEEAVLHSSNLVVSRDREEYVPYALRWQERGGRWLINQGMRALRDETVDLAQHWADLLGGTVWDGSIHDEVLTEDVPLFERYADGLARFRAMPESEGKTVYLYCGGPAAIGDPTLLDFFESTEETAVHGERSILCVPQGDLGITARQMSVRLEPGVEYTISAYMRSADAVAGSNTGVFVIDEGWNALYGRLSSPEGDSEWARYQRTFTPRPSRNELYQVLLCGPASGQLWIDAVQIERGSEATDFAPGEPNVLENASFEDGIAHWMRGIGQQNPLRDAVIEHAHAFAPEIYIHEQATEERARNLIDQRLVLLPASWGRNYAGVNPQSLIVLSVGDFSLRYANDHFPNVNYKVLLDMQMHAMAAAEDGATDLRGVGFWSAHYGTLEALRWYGALFRHYCIEGNTTRLTDDPYLLDHLTNPGFAEGLEGWETAGAVEAVPIAEMTGGGPRAVHAPVPRNENVLRTIRAEGAGANSFGQPIRNLTPGRLYSLKFYCADTEYTDRLVAAEITIEGGEVLPEYTWDNVLQMGRDGTERWTMYYRVFRAGGEQGRLTISDAAPGAVYWDFVQIEPFFEG
jgi:hypothetical protein